MRSMKCTSKSNKYLSQAYGLRINLGMADEDPPDLAHKDAPYWTNLGTGKDSTGQNCSTRSTFTHSHIIVNMADAVYVYTEMLPVETIEFTDEM